ncbi:MAG: hypothetical protein PHT07_05670 [Paludibacter sp.]|nr:hypothetical protein [Paludibacter sp.]
MTKVELKDMRTKILQGIEMSYNKLLSDRQKEDGDLIFSENGKVIKVKARELKKTSRYIKPSEK